MSSLLRQCAVLALPLAAVVAAQSSSDKVWAAVAFINHGERTPIAGDLRMVLTPEGAQQMRRQGSAFRARYVPYADNRTQFDHIERSYIDGLSVDVINNDLLELSAQSHEWVSAGAQAFLQSLYPASTMTFDNTTGGKDLSRTLADDGEGNFTDYPLEGYQYPNLNTLSFRDQDSTYIQGNERCPLWESEMSFNLTENALMLDRLNSTLKTYQTLFSTSPLVGTYKLDRANVWNAYQIYDLVNYMYTHNETVHDGLDAAGDVLEFLSTQAVNVERAKNSNLLTSKDPNDAANILYTIAGRTLMTKIGAQLLSNIRWGGSHDKLTLMFGSYEPILGFTSLAGLLDRSSIFRAPFDVLPQPGAALVFELYGPDAASEPGRGPTLDQFSVRVFYRASAALDADFDVQPVFGSKAGDGRIGFPELMQAMQDLAVGPDEWCVVCGDNNAPWCQWRTEVIVSDPQTTAKKALHPALAGVIGAAIMLIIVGLVFVALMLFGGFRLKRDQAAKDEAAAAAAGTATTAPAGGFKGPEKMQGDQDVAVTKGGVHHERVGSWELRDGAKLTSDGTGIAFVPGHHSPWDLRRSLDDDEVSVMGATPVKARESI